MAILKRRAAITKPSCRKSKTYEIDGRRYKSKALQALHAKLRDDALVSSFSLPTVEEEKANSNRKYGAKKCWINEMRFDSVMEARFYVHLLHQVEMSEVQGFERQVAYVLQDKYRDRFTKKVVPAIKYIADFVLTLPDGRTAVIDVKGKETADFKLKKKMFGYRYPDTRFVCVQWSDKAKDWLDLDEIKKARRSRAEKKKKQA